MHARIRRRHARRGYGGAQAGNTTESRRYEKGAKEGHTANARPHTAEARARTEPRKNKRGWQHSPTGAHHRVRNSRGQCAATPGQAAAETMGAKEDRSRQHAPRRAEEDRREQGATKLPKETYPEERGKHRRPTGAHHRVRNSRGQCAATPGQAAAETMGAKEDRSRQHAPRRAEEDRREQGATKLPKETYPEERGKHRRPTGAHHRVRNSRGQSTAT